MASPARGLDWPLVGHHVKVWILTGTATVAVGLPAIFGICVVQEQVRRHTPGELDTSDIGLAVNARAQTRRFLGLAGTAIGLAVLASGALQRAVVPQFVEENDLPSSPVLLYGAFFTAILTVVYLPAHVSLRRLCADLREMWYPLDGMPSPTDDGFARWIDGRKRIDGLTQVDMTVSQHLQAAAFVFTRPSCRASSAGLDAAGAAVTEVSGRGRPAGIGEAWSQETNSGGRDVESSKGPLVDRPGPVR